MTAFMDIGSSTPMLATMIGLAVGIDYALFILARYRSELQHTDDREEAVGIAVGTAGSAVVFAGLTVLIALAALAVVGIPFLTAMGLAAAATVLIAVLVALTLLPAILGLLKSKAFGGQVRHYRPKRERRRPHPQQRRPLGTHRRPRARSPSCSLWSSASARWRSRCKGLHLAFPSDSTASVDTTQRKASDLMADAFGPGRDGPLLVVVDATRRARGRPAARRSTRSRLGRRPGRRRQRPGRGRRTSSGTGAQVLITPASGPDDTATEDLLTTCATARPASRPTTGTTTGVTGLTAITTDVSERLSDALPVYLAVVIGLAFILLMIVFRSILVPLTATLGFLLSVLATLGAPSRSSRRAPSG